MNLEKSIHAYTYLLHCFDIKTQKNKGLVNKLTTTILLL